MYEKETTDSGMQDYNHFPFEHKSKHMGIQNFY